MSFTAFSSSGVLFYLYFLNFISLSSDEPHSKLTLSLFEIGQQAGSFLVVGLWSWEFVPYDIGQQTSLLSCERPIGNGA